MKGIRPRYEDMNKPKLPDTAQLQTTTLSIDGMSCGACVPHVTKALEGLSGVVHVHVDLRRNQASVEHMPNDANERVSSRQSKPRDTKHGSRR